MCFAIQDKNNKIDDSICYAISSYDANCRNLVTALNHAEQKNWDLINRNPNATRTAEHEYWLVSLEP